MDAVNAFNVELFSMIDMKPPISRAKMMSVTKSAIKAIKLYKHVVQLVEKFVKKCKPELKVPGLYVVDSIVRQSRHQFGVDKDVFGPRFLKNFTETFHHLYCCPEEDKTKILRVLNLWQKNGVFEMDIIQPLMDMAHRPAVAVTAPVAEVHHPEPQVSAVPSVPPVSADPAETPMSGVEALAAMAQLFQTPQGQELQRVLQNLQQGNQTLAAAIENNLANNPAHTNAYSSHSNSNNSFTEKLLDRFDYDEEPEEKVTKENHAQLLSIAENVLKQFAGQLPETQNVQPQMTLPASEIQHNESVMNSEVPHPAPVEYNAVNEPYTREPLRDASPVRRDSRHRSYGRRSRSHSRSPRRRRSRSSSRSRRSRHRRSRSKERHRKSRSTERAERERERERRQKGLPIIKGETLSVCTTTLWVGQLDKKTQQTDIMLLLEEFGQIESVNMIPPRGCAYIVMVHRQDANNALNKLSRGSFKVNQKHFKIAWALNKGIKSAHKKFWDVERGVTYVPWNKVKVEELDSYREGGMIDPESVNPEWGLSEEFFNKQNPADVAAQGAPTDGAAPGSLQVPLAPQPGPMLSPPPLLVPGLLSPSSVQAEAAPVVPAVNVPAANGAPAAPLKSLDAASADPALTESPAADAKAEPSVGSPGAPPFNMPGPFPPPGMPPPGMPPHMPPFMGPPPMGRPPMMPGGPMFPPDRFGMPMPFPPRGPPFPRPGMDMGPFRPGFGPPPFRPRW